MDTNETKRNDILARSEPLLLFLVFYLPGYLAQSGGVSGRVFNNVAFNLDYLLQALPRMALLLYVVLQRSRLTHPEEAVANSLAHYGIRRFRFADIGWSLLILIVIELILVPLSVIGGRFSVVHWQLTNPAIIPLVLVTTMAAGYSEELFFRSYLLTTLPAMGIGTASAVVTSTLLFALGHLYEGVVGFVGTIVIGTVMAIVFLRKRNLHAIAIAHGLYNFVTLLATLSLGSGPT